jgi:hypothetical protein
MDSDAAGLAFPALLIDATIDEHVVRDALLTASDALVGAAAVRRRPGIEVLEGSTADRSGARTVIVAGLADLIESP